MSITDIVASPPPEQTDGFTAIGKPAKVRKTTRKEKEVSPEDLMRSINAAKTLREQIAAMLTGNGAADPSQLSADDVTVLQDTFDGETTLDEELRKALLAEDEDQFLVDGIRLREKELASRRQRLERRIEARRGLMEQAMAIAQWTKHTCDIATFSLGAARPKVMVDVEADIPSQFFKKPDPPEPVLDTSDLMRVLAERHEAMKAALEIEDPEARDARIATINAAHPEIPGCHLETGGVQLTIRRK